MEHTQAAQAAKQIKAILKKAYPTVKFSVKSDTYSNGDHVDVSYTDGPTAKEVEGKISQFKLGHFDGMTDCYEYSNSREDIPQTKFLFVNRDLSENTKELLKKEIMSMFGIENWNDNECRDKAGDYGYTLIWKAAQDRVFPWERPGSRSLPLTYLSPNPYFMIQVPAHPNTVFDETKFLSLLEHSLSLTIDEKLQVWSVVPKLSQDQINQLMAIFEEEKTKFADPKYSRYENQVKKLQSLRAQEWAEANKSTIEV